MEIGGILGVIALLYIATSNKESTLDETNPPIDPSDDPNNITIVNIVEQLPKHPSKTYNQRSLSGIDGIVWHHSAWPNGDPWDYAALHVKPVSEGGRNWAGIGYTFVIQKDGTIYQTNYLSTKSNHATDANTKKIGCCFTGNFENEIPTLSQIDSAVYLSRYLNDLLQRQLSHGKHSDYKNTACPGSNLDINTIINRVYLST